MPGKLWSAQEKQLLRRQIKAGVPLTDVGVLERTTVGIAYQLRQLKLYPTKRWRNAEVRLLRNEAKTGKPPWKITILGRSPLAVRNKMLRLQLWKPKCHNQEPWMRTEMNRLKHLVINRGYTALQAVANGYFIGRSIHSVAQQMRRCGWKRTRLPSRVSRRVVDSPKDLSP